MVKKIPTYFRRLLYGAGALLLIFVIYLGAAVLLAVFPSNREFREAAEGIDIYANSNGVHVDIVLPVRAGGIDWRERLAAAHVGMADSQWQYIGFGWGDREFYLNTPTWEDLDWWLALRSLFWPTTTVMHVSLYRYRLKETEYVRRITLDEQQYAALTAFIERSFQSGPDGKFRILSHAGYGYRDRFYQAIGKYTLFYTCNNWTNEALKAAGIKTARWAPFAEGVMYHLD